MDITSNRKKRIGRTAACIRKYAPEVAQEIDDPVGELTELANQEANRIITEARAQAEQISKQAVAKAEEESAKYLTELMRKAEQKVAEFEEEARTKVLKELDQCARVINKARHVLRQVGKITDEATEKEPEAAPHLTVVEEQIETHEPTSHEEVLYHGEVELEVKSSGDFGQVGRFIGHLRKVPDIELKSFGTFVQGKITAIVAIAEPLRLLSILKQMPLVEEVVGNGNNIQLALKST